MVSNINAINAYQNAAKTVNNPVESEKNGSVNFAGMVNNALDDSISVMRKGEATASASLVGDVSLEELAAAVNNAEVALKTVVAVRDRVLSAYQDIIKMPI